MILLLDLDNVIRDASWREGLSASEGWDAYHKQGINDKPIQEIIELVRDLNHSWSIVALTGCTDNYRTQTMGWLINNRVPVDQLLMRRKGDFRPTPEVKLELVKTNFPTIDFSNFVIIDDRDDVCTVFREAGITALQCYKRQQSASKPLATGIKGGSYDL
jgi:hypothetical protein